MWGGTDTSLCSAGRSCEDDHGLLSVCILQGANWVRHGAGGQVESLQQWKEKLLQKLEVNIQPLCTVRFFFSDTNLIAQQTEQVRYAEFPRLVRN